MSKYLPLEWAWAMNQNPVMQRGSKIIAGKKQICCTHDEIKEYKPFELYDGVCLCIDCFNEILRRITAREKRIQEKIQHENKVKLEKEAMPGDIREIAILLRRLLQIAEQACD